MIEGKENNSNNESLLEAPPTFQLPNDFESNRKRYELWSVSVPVNFDMKCLDNVELSIASPQKRQNNENKQQQSRGGTSVGQHISEFQVHNTMHAITSGHLIESEHFRMLHPKQTMKNESSDDDDDSDDSSSSKNKKDSSSSFVMTPIPFVFDKQIHISEIPSYGETETDIAPSTEGAVKPDVSKMRIAYSDIPQATGLKRRWNPIGFNAKVSSSLYQKTLQQQQQQQQKQQREKQKKKTSKTSSSSTPNHKSDRKRVKSAKKSSKKSSKKTK